MEVGPDGDDMVNATSRVVGERNYDIENVKILGPEMEDATAVDGLINIHLAN